MAATIATSKRLSLHSRTFAYLWIVGIFVISALLIAGTRGGPSINTNVMALLPPDKLDTVVYDAVRQVQARFERHLVVLIGTDDLASSKAAAVEVTEQLADTGVFQKLKSDAYRELVKRAFSFYLPLRYQLLSNRIRAQLQAGDTAGFERSVLKRYYNPSSPLNSRLVERDPLLFLQSFLEERAVEITNSPRIDDGYLTVESGNMTYIVILGQLTDTPFSVALQRRLTPVLHNLKARLNDRFPEANLLVAGVLPHAAAGTETAIAEISTVGLGSILCIVLLLVGIFRTARPFALTFVSIALGSLAGFAMCQAIFGEVHLLTLVFGSSLVGISVDYSLHFFCDRFRLDQDWSPLVARRHILPGITLGLITSIIGFSGFMFTPFPGMQGMAVFSSVGLCVAYSIVVICYPHFTGELTRPQLDRPLEWLKSYADLWRRRWRWPALSGAAVLLVIAIFGCLHLTASDDVRLLQTPNKSVMAEEVRVRSLIGRNLSSQFFLVEGRDEADLLSREENLTTKLRALKNTRKLDGYLAISDFIASPQRQLENRDLLQLAFGSNPHTLTSIAEKIGLPDSARESFEADLRAVAKREPVTIAQWLSDPVSEPYRHLSLDPTTRGMINVVGLRGVFDRAALRDLADSDTSLHFIDPAGDITTLFGQYREQAIWLTLISYVFVLLLLMVRYGLKGGIQIMLTPVLAGVLSFATLTLIGESISLFNVMALLLVLGIGVDYAIFFRETGTDSPATYFAIALSSITTLSAFGLLAFSETAAIHAFGLTVLIGIFVAFLLSPSAERRPDTSAPR